MSDTAQLFMMAGAWLLIAFAISLLAKGWRGRLVVYAALVAALFWELPYGYYNFRRQCDQEIKWRSFEPIAAQDSICVSNLDSTLYAGLTKLGFLRIEVTSGSNDVKRDQASGHVVRVSTSEVKSNYCLTFQAHESLPWRIARHDALIVHARDQRIAGRQGFVIWSGMWWQEVTHPILGRGGMCFEDPWRGLEAIRLGTSQN